MTVTRIHTHSYTQANGPAPSHVNQAPDSQRAAETRTAQATTMREQGSILTAAERAYFEQLYPESAEAVRAYTPYGPDGAHRVATVGTLIDRKG